MHHPGTVSRCEGSAAKGFRLLNTSLQSRHEENLKTRCCSELLEEARGALTAPPKRLPWIGATELGQ